MMRSKGLLLGCAWFIFYLAQSVLAQTDTEERWFLLHPPGGANYGVAGSGVAIPWQSAAAFLFNPAVQQNPVHRSVATEYFTNRWQEVTGKNFKQTGFLADAGFRWSPETPVTVSVRAGFTGIDLGTNTWASQTGEIIDFEARETMRAIGVSVGWTKKVIIALGANIKSLQSLLGPKNLDGQGAALLYDVGFFTSIPLYKMTRTVGIYINANLGFAYLNYGDRVLGYGESVRSQLLVRSQEGGWSLETGVTIPLSTFRIEMMHILIGNQYQAHPYYEVDEESQKKMLKQGTPYFPDAFLLGISAPGVDIHNGYQFTLFEALKVSEGRYHAEGRRKITTSGVGISLSPIMRIVADHLNHQRLRRLLRNSNLEFWQVDWAYPLVFEKEVENKIKSFHFSIEF